ncbi:MAG: hypothetical protein WD426_11430 [Anditalea sp.]
MKKSQLIETLGDLPEEFSIDELVERLFIIQEIDKGIKDLDENRSMSEEEAKKKIMKRWQN